YRGGGRRFGKEHFAVDGDWHRWKPRWRIDETPEMRKGSKRRSNDLSEYPIRITHPIPFLVETPARHRHHAKLRVTTLKRARHDPMMRREGFSYGVVRRRASLHRIGGQREGTG